MDPWKSTSVKAAQTTIEGDGEDQRDFHRAQRPPHTTSG